MIASVERAALFVLALLFLGIGVWLFISPEALEIFGIQLQGPEARIDVRATYGGMELGFAAFLLVCLRHDAWVRVGLTASGCVIAGFGFARLLAIGIEGQSTPMMWGLVGFEIMGVAVIYWVLRRAPHKS